MNNEQEYLRSVVNLLIRNKGVKAAFICSQTGISDPDLSRFRAGHKYLDEQDFKKLKDYINNQ